jgi:bacterioferritin
MPELDNGKIVALLNRILESELAGVVRYTHYSFLVFGFGRIPIVSWLRSQANEALLHAQQAGEMITHLGAYPSLAIGPLLDTHKHDIGAILRESLESEAVALALYKELLESGCRSLSHAGRVRPPDDFRRGDARRGSRQDAAQTR